MADDFDPYYTWLGIPPKDQPPTHYRLLGVELFEANADVIENAADRQIAHIRLFQNGPQGDRSQKLLNEITTAKLCLLNAAKKAEYDEQLRATQKAAEEAARPQGRAVRGKSQPTAAADPSMPFDEALDVVSVDRDPLVLPKFSTPGVSAANNEKATARPTPSDRRKKLPLLIAGGAVAVLAVVALAWIALRPGPPAKVAGTGGGGTTPVDPPPVDPGKKSSIDNPVLPPDKTPFIETKTKQPIDSKTPVDPPPFIDVRPKVVSPAAAGFESNRVLRFVDRDHVELLDTVAATGPQDAPFTAEMWVRINPTTQRCYLMGNVANPSQHPEAPSGMESGWALAYHPLIRVGTKDATTERSGLVLQAGGTLHYAGNSDMDDDWHHLAICREPTPPNATYQVFLDGRRVMRRSIPPDAQRPSPANLALGCPPYKAFVSFVQTNIACRAFRLSSLVRYRETFTPPATFESDAQALSCLDFARGEANLVPDRSRGGHAGRVFGAAWMTAEGLLPASGGATNCFFSIDVARDSIGGKWTLARPPGLPPDQLEVAAPAGAAVLRLTDTPPPEYDLDLLVRKREGNGSLAIGLACGGRRVALLCEAADNGNTLLQHVSGKSASPVHKARLFPTDQQVALLIQVRAGRIVVLADGKSILDWRGDVADLQLPPSLAALPIGDGLFLAPQDASFRFDKLNLIDMQPRELRPAPQIYLDDLTEEDSSIGFGKLGKHGQRGYGEASPTVFFRGRSYTHALSLHPPRDGKSHVTYRLPPQQAEFRATAALLERTDWQKAGAPQVFRVFGDDKLLWESSPIQVHGTGQECSVSVRGVSLLKLEIECQGVNHGAHTAWLTPVLVRTSGKVKATPAKTPPAAIVKSATPDDAALAPLLEEVRKTFADDYAKAKTPDDRLKIAEKLFKESSQPGLDARTRYALLYESRLLAADNGSLSQASAAIDEILAKFDAPPGPLWSDTLGRAVKSAKTNEARREVALACMAQAPLAFRAEQYAAAESMLTQAATLLAQRDPALVRRARDLAKEATEAKDRLTQATAAEEALKANSGDAKARLALGKYLCFVKDDWSKGLEHLTKAGDDPLVKVAQRDQPGLTDVKEQETLAEAWATWSKTGTVGFDREGGTRRALFWHLKALQSTSTAGAAKTKLAQRVEELAGKLAAADSLIAHTPWFDSDPAKPRKWFADQRYVESLSISRDGLLLATSGSEGSRVWHLASGRMLRDFPNLTGRAVALSPDARLLAVDQYSELGIWDLQTGKRLKELAYGGSLYRLKFSDDGQFVLAAGSAGGRGGFAQVWETKSGRTVRRVDTTTGNVYSAALSPDARVLAYAENGPADNHVIRLIETATGKERVTLAGRYRRRNDIAFSPDGRRVASVGYDGASLCNAADGKLIAQLTSQLYETATFSADGSRLLLGGSSGVDVRRADGQLIRHIPRPFSGGGSHAAFAPSGRAAVLSSREGEVQIWGLAADDKESADGRSPTEPKRLTERTRMTLEVRLAVADVRRVTGNAEKPFEGDNAFKLAGLLRAQARPKAVELGADPVNIGLPDSANDLTKLRLDGSDYVGPVAFDFYPPRS